MHLGIWGKHTHWNVYKCVHWYRQNIAQKKVIWYKKWEILSFRPKFHFLNYIFHIWRDPHAPRYMGKHTHWNVYKCVHWYRQKIAQKKVIWYKKWEILSFGPKFHFLNYIFHIWRDPHAPRYMGTNIQIETCTNFTCPLVPSEYSTQTKVIWYKKWEILSFGPKFHFLNYIFHIWRDPHAPRYMGKTYTLKRVQMCPLVSSEYSTKESNLV